MSDDFVFWPRTLGVTAFGAPQVPFTRSGGRSLGSVERSTRTDRGYWTAVMREIVLSTREKRRAFDALAAAIGGKAGLVVVPFKVRSTAPYLSGEYEAPGEVTFDEDEVSFDDDTSFEEPAIVIDMAEAAAIGDTVVTLRVVNAAADLSGITFSYNHAAYKTGPAIEINGDLWTVPVVPAIRAAIPADAYLEADNPTCLMRLASDREMDVEDNINPLSTATVNFVEAVDHWNDVAA